ncbi:hypothetical protein BD779DRAFT_1468581 [Infundibulicybe gibba]|nr:hypothetical protein BD779DRAFT_1468581 [Infundibulicybe gibba]
MNVLVDRPNAMLWYIALASDVSAPSLPQTRPLLRPPRCPACSQAFPRARQQIMFPPASEPAPPFALAGCIAPPPRHCRQAITGPSPSPVAKIMVSPAVDEAPPLASCLLQTQLRTLHHPPPPLLPPPLNAWQSQLSSDGKERNRGISSSLPPSSPPPPSSLRAPDAVLQISIRLIPESESDDLPPSYLDAYVYDDDPDDLYLTEKENARTPVTLDTLEGSDAGAAHQELEYVDEPLIPPPTPHKRATRDAMYPSGIRSRSLSASRASSTPSPSKPRQLATRIAGSDARAIAQTTAAGVAVRSLKKGKAKPAAKVVKQGVGKEAAERKAKEKSALTSTKNNKMNGKNVRPD